MSSVVLHADVTFMLLQIRKTFETAVSSLQRKTLLTLCNVSKEERF